MDNHFDIGRVFEIGKFDITRLTCSLILAYTVMSLYNARLGSTGKGSVISQLWHKGTIL